MCEGGQLGRAKGEVADCEDAAGRSGKAADVASQISPSVAFAQVVGVVVEVDGPVHFHCDSLAAPTYRPSTTYKSRALTSAAGIRLVRVPFWELDVLKEVP